MVTGMPLGRLTRQGHLEQPRTRCSVLQTGIITANNPTPHKRDCVSKQVQTGHVLQGHIIDEGCEMDNIYETSELDVRLNGAVVVVKLDENCSLAGAKPNGELDEIARDSSTNHTDTNHTDKNHTDTNLTVHTNLTDKNLTDTNLTDNNLTDKNLTDTNRGCSEDHNGISSSAFSCQIMCEATYS